MAASIKVQHGKDNKPGEAPRRDFFFIHPSDIIADPAKNRRRKPVPDIEIQALAENMKLMGGNIQPVLCRKVKDVAEKGPDKGKTLELVLGYSRHRAAAYIVKEGQKDFKLKVMLTDANDHDAALANITENRFRNKTTPIDDAYNQQWMREALGYTNTQIATFYKMSEGRVSQLTKLLSLAKDVQDAISDRLIEANACMEMADLSEAKQLKILKTLMKEESIGQHYDVDSLHGTGELPYVEQAEEEQPSPARTGPKKTKKEKKAKRNPKISGAKVRKAVRAEKEAEGKKTSSLTRKEIVEYFENLNVSGEHDTIRNFSKRVVKFCNGLITEAKMTKEIYALAQVENKTATESSETKSEASEAEAEEKPAKKDKTPEKADSLPQTYVLGDKVKQMTEEEAAERNAKRAEKGHAGTWELQAAFPDEPAAEEAEEVNEEPEKNDYMSMKQAVLHAMLTNPDDKSLNATQISRVIDQGANAVDSALKALERDNSVKQTVSGYYKLTDSGRVEASEIPEGLEYPKTAKKRAVVTA